MAPQAYFNFSIAVRNNDVDQLRSFPAKKHDGKSDYNDLVKAMKMGRKRIVNMLLEKGNCVIQQGNALHMAVARLGWSSVVEKLLALGARVSDKNSRGDTALHLAFVNGATDRVVDLLLANYLSETTVNVENNDGLNFLHIACTRSTLALVQQFIDRGVDDINCQVHLQSQSQYAGYSPLHFAVLFGRYEIAALLLRNGASIYVQDRAASTPVHLALYKADQQMIDLLLAHDQRNENYINNFGLTHFMAACAGSMPHITEEFLYGQPTASELVNARVQDAVGHPYAGYSPIHFATKFGNLDTVQLLFDYGASSFSMTSDNCSPTELAQYTGRQDILQLIQSYLNRENEALLISKISSMNVNYTQSSF